MTNADYRYVKSLAADKRVSLTESEVKRSDTLGRAIDKVLDAAERRDA